MHYCQTYLKVAILPTMMSGQNSSIIEKVAFRRTASAVPGCTLPFSGSAVRIFQGYNGPYSHFAVRRGAVEDGRIYDYSFSLDFALPFGTPVRAVLDGIVIGAFARFCYSYKGTDLTTGLTTFSNLIVIEHAKNLFSVYSHIAHNGLAVELESMVKKGDVIAITGDVGWIGPEPHLHFALYEEGKNGFGRLTNPALFDEYSGALEHSEII
jgi:murein DD-endopeptidase MepM/ murein hydrolase activator NlpD